MTHYAPTLTSRRGQNAHYVPSLYSVLFALRVMRYPVLKNKNDKSHFSVSLLNYFSIQKDISYNADISL